MSFTSQTEEGDEVSMRTRPPDRALVSELVISALIYAGSLAASLLIGLCVSVLAVAVIPNNIEGALFRQPAILNCAILAMNPFIFAFVAANHCRRTPIYFIPLTAVFGLRQTFLLWTRNSFTAGEVYASVFCALMGLVLGFWANKRRQRSFQVETTGT